MTDIPEDIRAKAGGLPSDILKTAMTIMSSSLVKFDGGIEGGAVVRCIVDGMLLERERSLALIQARKDIYERKREKADALEEGDMNKHELISHTIEAFEWLLADIRNPTP